MNSINLKNLIVSNFEIEGILNQLEAQRIEALLRSMKGVIAVKVSVDLSNLELVTREKLDTQSINSRLTLIGEFHLLNYFVLNGVITYL